MGRSSRQISTPYWFEVSSHQKLLPPSFKQLRLHDVKLVITLRQKGRTTDSEPGGLATR